MAMQPATDVIMDPALVNKKQLHVKEVTSRKPAVVMDEMEGNLEQCIIIISIVFVYLL